MAITNPTLAKHFFLEEMYHDSYFPNPLVERGQQILIQLCEQIENILPQGDEVLVMTHAATERFNDLAEAFYEQESEIETAARECIAADFDLILSTYGFDVDLEEAIAPRDW